MVVAVVCGTTFHTSTDRAVEHEHEENLWVKDIDFIYEFQWVPSGTQRTETDKLTVTYSPAVSASAVVGALIWQLFWDLYF